MAMIIYSTRYNTMDNKENIAADGKDMDDMNLFAVTPFDWCSHLKDVCAIPANGLGINAPCMECGNVGEECGFRVILSSMVSSKSL